MVVVIYVVHVSFVVCELVLVCSEYTTRSNKEVLSNECQVTKELVINVGKDISITIANSLPK